MVTHYKIEFDDVNGKQWDVAIKDMQLPWAYDLRVDTLPPLNPEAVGFRYMFTYSQVPEDVESITFTAGSSSENTTDKSGVYITNFLGLLGVIVSMTLHRAGKPDEVVTIPAGGITEQWVSLTAAMPAVVIKTINNDDDKTSAIRAKEAVIKFLGNAETSIQNFIDDNASELRWQVTVKEKNATVPFFVGYLTYDDMSEALQDMPVEVTLYATDRLGALKDVPMRNFTGMKFTGITSIVKYIAMCLQPTGLNLPIKICDTALIKTASGTENLLLKSAYINSKTFIANDDVDNCYNVISSVLGNRCYVCQEAGYWVIKSFNSFTNANNTYRYFNKYGEEDAPAVTIDDSVQVGVTRAMRLINRSANVSIKRAVRKLKVKYKFEGADELLTNAALVHGAFVRNESLTTPPNGRRGWETPIVGGSVERATAVTSYTATGWTVKKINTSTGAELTNDTELLIRRKTKEGIELLKTLTITPPLYANRGSYMIENTGQVSVDAGDKLMLKASMMYAAAALGDGLPVAQILLYASDGSLYSLNNAGSWISDSLSNPIVKLTLNAGLPPRITDNVQVYLENGTIRDEAGKGAYSATLPKSGYVKVRFWYTPELMNNGSFSYPNKLPEVDFWDIKIDVLKYFGRNDQLTSNGQQVLLFATQNNVAVTEIDLSINSSIKSAFKGAIMLINAALGYDLAQIFKNNNKEYNSYAELVAVEYMRQFGRTYSTVSGQAQIFTNAVPDLLKTYKLDEFNGTKHFALLSYSYDLSRAAIDNIVFGEVYDVNNTEDINAAIKTEFIN